MLRLREDRCLFVEVDQGRKENETVDLFACLFLSKFKDYVQQWVE